MARIDLRRSCVDCISQLAGDALGDALLYLDAGAGEAFHFMGALGSLLRSSIVPRSVCSLENASPLDGAVSLSAVENEPIQKIVIITTRLLSDAHRYVLRSLRAHSSVTSCTILTSISEEAHSVHPDTPLGSDAFQEYTRLLLEDIQDLLRQKPRSGAAKWEDDAGTSEPPFPDVDGEVEPNFQKLNDHAVATVEGYNTSMFVEVKHFPMIMCPLTSNVFVFPSKETSAMNPLSNKGDKALGNGLPYIEKSGSSGSVPIGATLLAHFLHSLSGQLGLKFDVFTLGSLSHEVGKLLTELSGIADVSGRSRRPAGLLLIDRTLDLITPCCHGDSLMDRFFSSLSRCSDKELQIDGANVWRNSLDTRMIDRKECKQDDSVPIFPSKEFLSLMSSFEKELHTQSMAETGETRAEVFEPVNGRHSNLCMSGITIFDSEKNHESGRIGLLFEKRLKESALNVRRWLVEALHREKRNTSGRSRLGAVSVQEIQLLASQLSQKSITGIRHADLIQISKAITLALDPEFGSKWEALGSAEKILSLSVEDSSQSVAFQIRDLVRQSIQTAETREEHNLISLRDALTLSIVGYALAGESFRNSVSGGPFSLEEERELKQAVIDAILLGHDSNLGFLSGKGISFLAGNEPRLDDEQDAEIELDEGWGAWGDEDIVDNVDTGENDTDGKRYGEMQLQLEARDKVEEIFKRLHTVSVARQSLVLKDKLDEGISFNGTVMQRSLLHTVLSSVFAKVDFPGMEHHSSAVGRFFKSGLGRFGLRQAKSKLSDNKVILVFIVGGLNGLEVIEAREAQAAYKMTDEIDVLIGGTTFLTPDDVFDLVFGSV